MIREHHKEAKEQGTMICHAGGLMSAIEDVSMAMCMKHLGCPLSQFSMYQMEAGVGGGGSTFLSGFEGYNNAWPNDMDALINPFSLGGHRKCGVREEDREPPGAEEDTVYPGIWTSAGHSTPLTHRLLRRTVELFEDDLKDGVQPPETETPKPGDNILIKSRYATMT